MTVLFWLAVGLAIAMIIVGIVAWHFDDGIQDEFFMHDDDDRCE